MKKRRGGQRNTKTIEKGAKEKGVQKRQGGEEDEEKRGLGQLGQRTEMLYIVLCSAINCYNYAMTASLNNS